MHAPVVSASGVPQPRGSDSVTKLLAHVKHNVIAYLALFVALGGTSYAAIKIPNNSVGTKQLRNGAVTSKKLDVGVDSWLCRLCGRRSRVGARSLPRARARRSARTGRGSRPSLLASGHLVRSASCSQPSRRHLPPGRGSECRTSTFGRTASERCERSRPNVRRHRGSSSRLRSCRGDLPLSSEPNGASRVTWTHRRRRAHAWL